MSIDRLWALDCSSRPPITPSPSMLAGIPDEELLCLDDTKSLMGEN